MIAEDRVSVGYSSLLPGLWGDSVAHPDSEDQLVSFRNCRKVEGRNWELLLGQVDRGGTRNAATSKVELFVIIVSGFQALTIITKSSTLDVAAVLDPLLSKVYVNNC